jgi:hypothetical protein
MKDANGKWIGYGLGDVGPQVATIQHRLLHAYPKNSQAVSLGVTESGTYDQATTDAVRNVQPFLKPPQLATGVANYATQLALGAATPPPPPPPAYRPIWIYSAPGSGAAWWLGPPFDVGQWCKDVLHLNHQPVNFPIGGYMGLMGGDPGLSYNEVIAAEGASLEWLLDNNPDVQKAMTALRADTHAPVDVELWFTAYSQSADGMEDALVRLFGDGGKYALIRGRINGTLMFGNPSRQPGPTKVGNNPPGWGIARKIRPQWLQDITWSITATSPMGPDFYAACDDEIRPLFYSEIVQAETSMSFAEHIVKIIIPVLLNLFGGLGSLLTGGLGGLLGPVIASADQKASEDVDRKIIDLFTVQGILTNIPALFKLLFALGGIQTHGSYNDPHDEFGGRTGVQVACDAVASFRR